MDTPPKREPRPDSVFFTDARGEIVFSNRYAERVVGRRLTDIADDFPMFHLDGRPYSPAERQVPRAIASGEAVVDEDFYGPDANRSRVRYRCSCWPVLDDGGQVVGTVSATRDVTAEHRRETELAYHASLLDHVDDAVVGTDTDFRLTVWNRGAEQLYGFTAEEVLGRPVREVISYAGDRARRDLERELLETDPARTEITAYRKGGTLVDVELVSTAVRDAAGAVAGYLGIHRDVSERKRTERSLRHANRQRETILESITDAFCALDRGWRFTYVNDLALRRIEDVMGRRVGRDEVLGSELWEMFPNLVGTDVECRYRQAMRNGRPAQFETRAATDDWVDVHVYPSENGLSIYLHDISSRKRAAEERDRRAHQQALVAGLGLRALAKDDLQALFDEAVAAVAEGLQATSAGLAEMLPGGQALVLRAGVGWQDAAVGTGRHSAARGSFEGYTVMTGEPVVSRDVEADPRFALSPFLRGYAPASAAAVVIAGRHGPFGALTVLSRAPHPFSADDVNFLQAVANVVSAAIERANAERLTLDVRQAERMRMARDLHDEALQDLTDALAQASAAGEDDAAECLTRLIPALKGAGRQVRAAINDLRLDAEGDRPIADLLEELVSAQREFATDLRIELVIDPGVPDGALGNAGTQLMRVAGEALVNARRHSGAHTVTVKAWTEVDHLRVEVSDDGHGCAAGAEARPGSTGIRGMRERLDLVRGDIAINSTAAGTTVRLGVPLGADVRALAHETRILLVEDHATVREAIAVMFDRAAGFEVVGQAGSLAEARTMLENVDVALVDLGLPDGFGGDLIKEMRDANPRAQALVISAGLQRRETARAIESGAAGALDKTVSLDEVVDAVRRVQAGEALIPLDEVVELLRLAARERDREHRDREATESLTRREREVLQLLADGLDTQEIAGGLHIAARTERNHVASIFGKLDVHSRLQAVLFALRYGIVKVR